MEQWRQSAEGYTDSAPIPPRAQLMGPGSPAFHPGAAALRGIHGEASARAAGMLRSGRFCCPQVAFKRCRLPRHRRRDEDGIVGRRERGSVGKVELLDLLSPPVRQGTLSTDFTGTRAPRQSCN